MKKILLFLCSLLTATMAKGQEVIDNFIVGPYEVDYRGQGDVNFRMRKGIDLYEYFGLERDTIIVESKRSQPVAQAFELGLLFSTPRFDKKGAFNTFGVYGNGKTKIARNVFFNYGGRVAVSYGHYNQAYECLKDVLLEVGVPLSIEFAKLDRTNPTLYANVGVTPSYYGTISAKIMEGEAKVNADKKSGVYVAPQIGIGGYIPFDGHLVKIGLYGEYRIGCVKEEDDIFKERIGRAFVGAKVGFVF